MGQKTTEIINDKDSREYQKVFWSENTRSLSLTALFVLAIVFVALWISFELGIFTVILFAPIFLYRIFDALMQPSKIVLRSQEFIISDLTVTWDQVQSVVFYRPLHSWLGIDGMAPFYYVVFPTYLAKIVLTDNRIIKFAPRLYGPDNLRKEYESEARKHGINVKVRDL